jgi:hypothetical protein
LPLVFAALLTLLQPRQHRLLFVEMLMKNPYGVHKPPPGEVHAAMLQLLLLLLLLLTSCLWSQ